MHARVGEFETTLTSLFRHVHRQVRVAEQLSGFAGHVAHGDPDTGGDLDVVTCHDERHAQRRSDPRRHLLSDGARVARFDQDRELVATESCNRVAIARDRPQSMGEVD